MVEDDDDAIDVVTFKEISIDTPGERVTKRVEVPLRSMVQVQIAPGNSEPTPQDHESVVFESNFDGDGSNEVLQHKVAQTYYYIIVVNHMYHDVLAATKISARIC